MMACLVPSTEHRLQICQDFKVRSHLWEFMISAQTILDSKLPHLDVPYVFINCLSHRNLAGCSLKARNHIGGSYLIIRDRIF